MKKMKLLPLLVGIGIVLVSGAGVVEGESLTQEVVAGEVYQIDCSWRLGEIVRESWLHPQLKAFDADGKEVYFRWDAGNFLHRAFDPKDAYVEKWRFYAQVRRTDGTLAAKTPGFSGGLQVLVIPSRAVRMEVKLVTAGRPIRFSEARIAVERVVGEIPKLKEEMPPFTQPARLLTDAELDSALAKAPRHRAELRSDGGRTTMLVDGRPFLPRIWKGGSDGEWEAVGQFGGCGFNLFKVQIELRRVWRPGDVIVASEVRERLRKCLRVNPAAMIVFQIGIRPRKDWGVENPDEVYQNEKGEFAAFQNCRVVAFTKRPVDEGARYPAFSYLSRKFAAEAADALGRLFAEIETWPESKNAIAVYVNGGADGQWLDLFDCGCAKGNCADYSPAGQRSYRDFLRKKYGSVEALRKAWGRADIASFDAVAVPAETDFQLKSGTYHREHGASPQSDWRECWARGTTEMRLGFAAAIKKATGRRMLVGSYSPNAGLEGFPLISETYARGLLESPDFDFFSVVPWYCREFTEAINAGAYNGSFVRRGKLYISELDLRNAEVATWGTWGAPFWRETHDAATFRRKAIYFACDSFVRGGTFHACDMGGHYYNTPAAMATWTLVNGIADYVRALPWSPDHVAVVGGERYWDHHAINRNRVLPYYVRQVTEPCFAYAGLPHANYLLEELLQDREARMPKLIVFNDLTTVSAAEFRELRRRYARDGRVIVYSWRLGLLSEDGAEIERELGLVPCPGGYRSKQVHADGRSADPLMRGVRGLFSFGTYYLGEDYAAKLYASGGDWQALANFDGTETPAVSVRRLADCTEVYVSAPNALPTAFARNLARAAGFEPTLETDDISGFGSGLFYFLAQTDGEKRVRLPAGYKPGKTLAGPSYRVEADGTAVVSLRRGEIFVLEVLNR